MGRKSFLCMFKNRKSKWKSKSTKTFRTQRFAPPHLLLFLIIHSLCLICLIIKLILGKYAHCFIQQSLQVSIGTQIYLKRVVPSSDSTFFSGSYISFPSLPYKFSSQMHLSIDIITILSQTSLNLISTSIQILILCTWRVQKYCYFFKKPEPMLGNFMCIVREFKYRSPFI